MLSCDRSCENKNGFRISLFIGTWYTNSRPPNSAKASVICSRAQATLATSVLCIANRLSTWREFCLITKSLTGNSFLLTRSGREQGENDIRTLQSPPGWKPSLEPIPSHLAENFAGQEPQSLSDCKSD